MKYLNSAQRLSNQANELMYVLIDLSPSMECNDYQPSRRAGAIEANRRLIEAKAELFPDDRLGIIGFSGLAEVCHQAVSLGEGASDLCIALRNIKAPGGGTNFIAPLELAERCILGGVVPNAPQGLLGRMFREIFLEPEVQNSRNISKSKVSGNITRRIIMLTDGEHNGGGCPVTIAQRLKDAGVIIECIGIAGRHTEVDENILKKIASPDGTGRPRYCFIGDTSSLIRKYKSMANQIRPVREADLDEQVLSMFAILRGEDKTRQSELRRRQTRIENQLAKLLDMRLAEEIDGNLFGRKRDDLLKQKDEITLRIEAANRQCAENAELAINTFELSQRLEEKWLNGLMRILSRNANC